VTLISVAFLIPFALLSPIAGVFVDRLDPRLTMIASDLIRAALALALVFAAGLSEIYAILFALSAVSTFFVPAQTIMIRTITPGEGVLAGTRVRRRAFQAVPIIAPAIAGGVVSWSGENPGYFLAGPSFFFPAGMSAAIPARGATAATEPSAPSQ